MHLYTNVRKLALTRGSSYTELSEWIVKKKAVINPKITMESVLIGPLFQHCITKTLSIIPRELVCFTITKTNTTEKVSRFH